MIFFPLVYADGQENYSSNCGLYFTRDLRPWGNQEIGGGGYDEKAFSLGALAKGIRPFCALVSLKDGKGHLLLFSSGEDE